MIVALIVVSEFDALIALAESRHRLVGLDDWHIHRFGSLAEYIALLGGLLCTSGLALGCWKCAELQMEGIGLVVKVARISRVEGLGQVIPNAFEQPRTHSLRAAFAQYVEAALGTGEGNIEQVEIVHYIL